MVIISKKVIIPQPRKRLLGHLEGSEGPQSALLVGFQCIFTGGVKCRASMALVAAER